MNRTGQDNNVRKLRKFIDGMYVCKGRGETSAGRRVLSLPPYPLTRP